MQTGTDWADLSINSSYDLATVAPKQPNQLTIQHELIFGWQNAPELKRQEHLKLTLKCSYKDEAIRIILSKSRKKSVFLSFAKR